MSKSKQFNFYVNPKEESELLNFLDSFPRMVRSTYIKSAINYYRQNGGSPMNQPSPQAMTQSQPQTPNMDSVLSARNTDFELDEDDL